MCHESVDRPSITVRIVGDPMLTRSLLYECCECLNREWKSEFGWKGKFHHKKTSTEEFIGYLDLWILTAEK